MEGRHGVLFASGDLDAAVEAVASLAGDEPRRLQLAGEALRSARERWSLEAMLDAHLALYERIGATR